MCCNLDLRTLFPNSSCKKVFGLFAPPTSNINICRKGLFVVKDPSSSRWNFEPLSIYLVLIQAKPRPDSLKPLCKCLWPSPWQRVHTCAFKSKCRNLIDFSTVRTFLLLTYTAGQVAALAILLPSISAILKHKFCFPFSDF